MLGLEDPPAPPFTPVRSSSAHPPTTPSSTYSPQSNRSFGNGNLSTSSPGDARRSSFPASSYRSSAVLETGSAIPLQFSTSDELREIQIRRARDSIEGMSSVLSDMKSHLDNVRRASTNSEPLLDTAGPPQSTSDRAAERAARIKALGAPWVPPHGQPPFPSPHGPPPSFKAPLSPLSPPQRPPQLQERSSDRSGGSPIDVDAFTTAEEQMSDEEHGATIPTLPRLSSANWRQMLSPSPTKATRPRSRPTSSLRQDALRGDDDDDSDNRIGAGDNNGSDNSMDRSQGFGSMNDDDETPEIVGVQEALRMHTVKHVPAAVLTEAPQPVAHEASVRHAHAPSDVSTKMLDLTSTPPVPPRHGEHRSHKRQHRYSAGDKEPRGEDLTASNRAQLHARSQSQPTQIERTHLTFVPHSTPSQPPNRESLPHSLPRSLRSPAPGTAPASTLGSMPSTSHPHATFPSRTPVQPQSHRHRHSRSQSRSGPSQAPHETRRWPDEAAPKRNFTKKSIEDLVQTAPTDHVYDLNDIDLPGPERRLLEKFVDSLSKLSIEIQMDKGKRDEGRRRLNNALRALEGWI